MSGLMVVMGGIVLMYAVAPFDMAAALVLGVVFCLIGLVLTWIELS